MSEARTEPMAGAPLFDGDHGRLGIDARRALVRLLKSTHLSARSHPDEWAALLAEREAVASVLNELFLVLEVDEVSCVAWKSQAAAEGAVFTTLLTQRRLTPSEMRVLLHLRSVVDEVGPAGSDAATIRGGELLDRMAAAYPGEKGDHVANREQDKAALRRLAKDDVLQPSHGQADDDPQDVVYTVSSIVEALMSPDRMRLYAEALRAGIAEDGEDEPPVLEEPAQEDDGITQDGLFPDAPDEGHEGRASDEGDDNEGDEGDEGDDEMEQEAASR